MPTLIDDYFECQVKIGQRWFVSKPLTSSFIDRLKSVCGVLTGRYVVVKFAEEEHARVKDWKKVTSLVSPLEIEKAKVAAVEARKHIAFTGQINSFGGLKIKKNHSCPCGSGKRFKNCHGKDV